MAKLNNKQAQFVLEYVKDFNATQAAIRAGYSKKTAGQQGGRLLKNVYLREELSKAIVQRSELTKIDAAWVLAKAADLANKCLGETKVMVPGKDGDDIEETQFHPAAARGALEIVGKHVDVKAFDNSIPLVGDPDRPLQIDDTNRAARIAEILAKALKR